MKRFASPTFFRAVLGTCVLFALAARPPSAFGEEVADLIGQIHAVGPQGAGSTEARAARDALAAKGPDVLPELLAGMDTPNVVAANWLRTAFDEVAQRALESSPEALPADRLRAYVLDPNRQGRVRRLALDVLSQLDASAPEQLIAPLLDDPEFRPDAVAMALKKGDRALARDDKDGALAAFEKAFDAARDEAQVRAAAAKLESLDREVSIPKHLGLLVDWYLIGPFNGPAFEVFGAAYPPEKQVDLQTSYTTEKGTIRWKRHHTTDEFGTVDLVTALAPADNAAAYAYTTVESPEPRSVEIRAGADDNLTIWLNGRNVFAKQEWQNGTRFDRFVIPVALREGLNEILVKVCQGPPYRDPGLGNRWSLQVRLCDEAGKGVSLPTLARDAEAPGFEP